MAPSSSILDFSTNCFPYLSVWSTSTPFEAKLRHHLLQEAFLIPHGKVGGGHPVPVLPLLSSAHGGTWPLCPCTSTKQEGTGLSSWHCVPGAKLRASKVDALRLFGDCNVAATPRSQTQLGIRKDFLIVQAAQTGLQACRAMSSLILVL